VYSSPFGIFIFPEHLMQIQDEVHVSFCLFQRKYECWNLKKGAPKESAATPFQGPESSIRFCFGTAAPGRNVVGSM